MSAHWITERGSSLRKKANELGFLDCSVWLGDAEGFPLAEERGFEELRKNMKDYFIRGGLFSHWWGKKLSAQAGNSALMETSKFFSDGMFAVWTGLPLFPDEEGPLPGVGDPHPSLRGVRVFPASHNFPLEEWVTGDLCRWLLEHKLPLFVWHTEVSLASLYTLAKSFQELNIILETQTKKILYHARVLFSLMRECQNVFIETSNFVGQGYIEFAVREFGAKRLLFGSFMPVNDPLVPIGMLLDAEIDEQLKRLIAGGNLERIIRGVQL
jgi:hypothetical protein